MAFDLDDIKLSRAYTALKALWIDPPKDLAAALGDWLYDEIGPCFTDAIRGGDTFVGSITTFRDTYHAWGDYRSGAFDAFFWGLEGLLPQDVFARTVQALSSTGAERIPESSAAGDDGLLFFGLVPRGQDESPAKRIDDRVCLRGIGPKGELVLRLRPIGALNLGVHPNSADAGGRPRNPGFPLAFHGDDPCTERELWRRQQKRNRIPELVKNETLGAVQPIDYAVCLPFATLAHLRSRRDRHALDEAGAAFIDALAAADPGRRDELARHPAPNDADGLAAAVTCTLLRYLLGSRNATLAEAYLEHCAAALDGAPAAAVDGPAEALDAKTLATYLSYVAEWRRFLTLRADTGGNTASFSYGDVFVSPKLEGAPLGDLLRAEALHAPGTAAPSKRLLISADSGMGKSTLLKGLAAACALRCRQTEDADIEAQDLLRTLLGDDAPLETAPLIPVLITQADVCLQGEGYDVLETAVTGEEVARALLSIMPRSAAEPLRQAGGDDAQDLFISLLRQPNVLVMVDSVDEVPLDRRKRYLDAIDALARDLSLPRLIITSRQLNPADQKRLENIVNGAGARIRPFDQDRQQRLYCRLATRYLADILHEPLERLAPFERFQAVPGMPELLGNPLMLTTLVRTYYDKPADALEAMLNEIERILPKTVEIDEYDRNALNRIAFECALEERTEGIPLDELVERFARYRAEDEAREGGGEGGAWKRMSVSDVVDRTVSRRGALSLRGGTAAFPYPIVQAYLASLWVRKALEEGIGFRSVDEAAVAHAEELAYELVAGDACPGAIGSPASIAYLLLLAAPAKRSPAHAGFQLSLFRHLVELCVFAGEDDGGRARARTAEALLRAAGTFKFGEAIPRPAVVDAWLSRLAAFAGAGSAGGTGA